MPVVICIFSLIGDRDNRWFLRLRLLLVKPKTDEDGTVFKVKPRCGHNEIAIIIRKSYLQENRFLLLVQRTLQLAFLNRNLAWHSGVAGVGVGRGAGFGVAHYRADRDTHLAAKWENVWHQLRIEDAAGIA